jgi:hypothetical protein
MLIHVEGNVSGVSMALSNVKAIGNTAAGEGENLCIFWVRPLTQKLTSCRCLGAAESCLGKLLLDDEVQIVRCCVAWMT